MSALQNTFFSLTTFVQSKCPWFLKCVVLLIVVLLIVLDAGSVGSFAPLPRHQLNTKTTSQTTYTTEL